MHGSQDRNTQGGLADKGRNHTYHHDRSCCSDHRGHPAVGAGFVSQLVDFPDHWLIRAYWQEKQLEQGINALADDIKEGTEKSASEKGKRWYVVHAYSGYERKVKLALEERIGLSPLKDLFGDVLVPTEEVLEMRGGQKRKSERKFFPGYVLLQMVLNDDTWHLVKETPRVMGFIGGTAEKPAPITQREVDEIMNRLEETVDKPSHKTVYEPGEMVRVTDGPFNDFTGTVEEVNYVKSRVRVAVSIFGRSTPVELEFSQVEKG